MSNTGSGNYVCGNQLLSDIETDGKVLLFCSSRITVLTSGRAADVGLILYEL